MTLGVLGVGTVFTRGAGSAALQTALGEGWMPPERAPGALVAAYRVDTAQALGPGLYRQLRRADRFCQLAVAASAGALREAPDGVGDQGETGLILASALGPHASTLAFHQELRRFGPEDASPTRFINTVQGSAASHIATLFGITGPVLTVTRLRFAFHHAVLLAEAWITTGACRRVLVGAVDEHGQATDLLFAHRFRSAPNGRLRPLSCSPRPVAVPGEGAVFLLCGPPGYGLPGVEATLLGERAPDPGADLYLLDADGLLPDETSYARRLPAGAPVASYLPLLGSLPSCSAFHAAVALTSLATQHRYPSPVLDGAASFEVIARPEAGRLTRVDCLQIDHGGQAAALALTLGRGIQGT